MDDRQALIRIRDEIKALHTSSEAILADFFDCVNVDEKGRLVVDGETLELDGAEQALDKRFGA